MVNKELLTSKDAWRDPEIYKKVYDFSINNPDAYWEAQLDRLSWVKRPTIISQKSENGGAIWFPDGKINACYNCVDRHAEKTPDKTALIWQSEDLNICEKISYKKLQEEVCRFANTLKKLGLGRKNYITVYMPMIPESIYACLACARLGIPYTLVFSGFSPSALALRMNDFNSDFIISCDASLRGGKRFGLKQNVDSARALCKNKVRTLIVKRQGIDIAWDDKLDNDYYELSKNLPTTCEIADTDSLSELFVLYTSGSVGKPKGVMHGTGGFLLFSSMTHKYFFDIQEDSVFWCSGDIGWMGGHAYSVYAPLCNGVTTLIFEGIPTHPKNSVFWEVIDKHKVSSFNTAPTALRAMMKNPEESLANTSRDSLKLIGVFGEILNKEAWHWYFNGVGKGKCPLVNMWGQTELGGVSTAPLCNLDDMETYGHTGRQFFGCKIVLKDGKGNPVTGIEKAGSMFIENSMPGMLLGIWGDKTAMKKIYYSQANDGSYCAGDEAYFDHDHNMWVAGRNDDVLNVSGHRVSPIEIEEVITATGITAEVSVVGYPHSIKGEGIFAFVVLKKDLAEEQKLNAKQIISDHVKDIISHITKPDIIHIVDDLPKTISGKIMRRILRKIASGDTKDYADISTLANHECLEKLTQNLPPEITSRSL